MSLPDPLIILTCMRSYSSLVSSMLGQHPQLYTLPEVNPFIERTLGGSVDLLSLVRKRSLDGLYRVVAELEFGGQSEATVAQAQDWVTQRRQWSFVRLFAHWSEKLDGLRLIDKSPSTVVTEGALDRALQAFPDAYYLHLYRHPVATCSSIAKITKLGQPGGRTPRQAKDPETSWYNTNGDIVRASLKMPPARFMAVRGEDVLGDPDRYLSQICEWLGHDCDARTLKAMRSPERSPYASLGPASAPFGNDPGFLRNPVYARREIRMQPLDTLLDWTPGQRRLRPETVALSNQLGYCDRD